MGGLFLWLFLLVVFLISGGETGFWFQFTLWGGIAMFIMALLSLLFGNGEKKKGYRTVRYGKEKKREDVTYTYLSVYFQTRGNWYYYLTDDPTIRPNDVVVVPWGKYNNRELAIVGWVEHRKAADVPYPLSRMKYMIRKASDNCRYAFDEMAEWPMKVNISSRWTRDEEGNGFQVVNSREEREKLRAWIRENTRLIPFEPMVIGEESESGKFMDAVSWYNIANADW